MRSSATWRSLPPRPARNDYRTYIDNNTGYYAYDCGTPKNNLALGAGSSGGYACNTWKAVSGTTNEWFHYVPDSSQLKSTTGGSAGQMLLEVTGRAGYPGNYQYRSIIVGFSLSGILTDSYYSEYEVVDPGQPNVYPAVANVKLGSVTTTYPLTSVSVEYAEDVAGNYNYYGPESLLNALCKYHTYNENTFIDSLGSVTNQWVGGGHSAASPTNPYYGPFYDENVGLSYTVPAVLPNGQTPPNAGATITVPSPGGGNALCGEGGQGIYPGSVVFNGIAYTNDQLALCGDPTFNAALESGAPSNVPYGDDWPGSVARVVGGVTEYFPQGYTYGFGDGCSSSSKPNFGATASPKTPVLNQDQHLPPTSAGFVPYADGTLANGCVFTGPTMIEFVKGGTMNVWSPLTQNPEPNGSDGAACGTYSPAQPWQTGLAVPSGAAIYVEGEQATGPNSSYNTAATAPTVISTPCASLTAAFLTKNEVDTYGCVWNPSTSTFTSAGSALQPGTAASGGVPAVPATTCLDPFYYNTVNSSNAVVAAPTSLVTCEEGDAIVGGEFSGQVTIAADNSIVVSRDLTYGCADGSGAASDANPAGVAACNSAGSTDVLALVPTQELVVAGPTNQPFNGGCAKNQCGTAAAPICSDDGTEASPDLDNVNPWSCDINNSYSGGGSGVVIDAAAVDLNGATYAQNYNIINLGGSPNLYQNGTNINYFPGLNGAGSDGYNQVITYDQRLGYLLPPACCRRPTASGTCRASSSAERRTRRTSRRSIPAARRRPSSFTAHP